MPDVKVKKSVLQSIIKKHLFESPAPDSGVPRRLTVGPDRSPLPQGLPLSPSDRMSVQLDVERPPVDDPDYMPENPRELGYAVQALAEMVPVEFVEKVYDGFKKVIEDAVEGDDDSEGEEMKMSDDVDLLNKFESFYRRSRLVNSLMSEAADDSDPEEDEEELERRWDGARHAERGGRGRGWKGGRATTQSQHTRSAAAANSPTHGVPPLLRALPSSPPHPRAPIRSQILKCTCRASTCAKDAPCASKPRCAVSLPSASSRAAASLPSRCRAPPVGSSRGKRCANGAKRRR